MIDSVSNTDKWLFKLFVMGFIVFCAGIAMPDTPIKTNDNSKFIVFDDNIFRIDAIDYAYKSYDKHRVSIASGDGNLFHININGIVMSYKTLEERDEKFSVLLRKLKLREIEEPL